MRGPLFHVTVINFTWFISLYVHCMYGVIVAICQTSPGSDVHVLLAVMNGAGFLVILCVLDRVFVAFSSELCVFERGNLLRGLYLVKIWSPLRSK